MLQPTSKWSFENRSAHVSTPLKIDFTPNEMQSLCHPTAQSLASSTLPLTVLLQTRLALNILVVLPSNKTVFLLTSQLSLVATLLLNLGKFRK